MTLTYHKAVVAAVLEQPPTKPTFPKDFPWRLRLDALRRYRTALARWKRIGDALDGQHVPYREITNTPSAMRGMPGGGTLRTPKGSPVAGRATDCSIVHTRPNHATRRRNGELGQARQDEIERQQADVRAALEAIARGTWGRPKQAKTYYGATADQFIYDEVA